jgi:hypothetical protein
MIVAVVLALNALAAQVVFPETPAGRCAAAYVRSFNSGDESAVREFELANRSESSLKARTMEERLSQYRELRKEWGTLVPRQIRSQADTQIEVLIDTQASGECFAFGFEFDKAVPGKLVAIRIEGPVSPAETTAAEKAVTPAEREAVVERLIKLLEDGYVFPDKVYGMGTALQRQLGSGEYDKITSPTDFARRLTDDLHAVCNDKHLRVRVAEPERSGSAHGGPRIPQDEGRQNYGFERVEVLAGNIGYVKLNGFSGQSTAQATAAAAMAFLANCDGLIFDLRENGGGSPEMIKFLSSYLFDKPTHLNSFYDRLGNKTSDTWTTESVPGKRFAGDLPVYVLTASRTFSAAEEFTYNLKCLKRATIVGETTGGGAHPVNMQRVNDRFVVTVPFSRAENPITRTNWEGVGVQPDISTPADRALDAAREDALKRIASMRGSR